MHLIRYECWKDLFIKGNSDWARVDNSQGQTEYEGTYKGAMQWLEDRRLKPCAMGNIATQKMGS